MMNFSRIAIAAVWCGAGVDLFSAHADELTRQVQEELRRRYQYFGEIDGRPSEELAAALKNFQKRKVLSLSGLTDETTIRSLGIGSAPGRVSARPPLPDVPVLRSDAAREISEADQEFLRNLEESGPETPGGVESVSDGVRPSSAGLEPTAIEGFVRTYLIAAQAETPDKELGLYADGIEYFDHGKVDRRFVEKDVRRYYRRWPERKYTLLQMQVTAQSPGGATVNSAFVLN
jgi:peptidoglycan hydrolase-like protein with peptidoglycan-binding domain